MGLPTAGQKVDFFGVCRPQDNTSHNCRVFYDSSQTGEEIQEAACPVKENDWELRVDTLNDDEKTIECL